MESSSSFGSTPFFQARLRLGRGSSYTAEWIYAQIQSLGSAEAIQFLTEALAAAQDIGHERGIAEAEFIFRDVFQESWPHPERLE